MRTTLTIDDDVLAAAKELADTQRRSIGEVISSLARNALRPARSSRKMRNGVPLLRTSASSQRITSELVRQLGDELP